MQTNIVAGEGYSIIQLIGKLDSDTAAKVDAVFTETMASEHVLLDFSKLKYISSAGLRILLLAAKKVQQAQGKLILYSLQPNVREIFDLSGFTSMFTILSLIHISEPTRLRSISYAVFQMFVVHLTLNVFPITADFGHYADCDFVLLQKSGDFGYQ